ncbi:hypothetical protein PILCRDRAFT_688571 [Piloderma croceum F 1598]|uniref:Protein kinase domain-containing protein n=1 Tax=Piloderma croceum (strain F 1598) TaxID=765440 RepID=A0A0C3F502_PILCF|nr:hypothetical protein PILCRDRAFT_688571 [Piloderma croceum F 1598]
MAVRGRDHERILLLRSTLSTKSSSSFFLRSTTLLDLTGHITRESDYYSAYSGSADIWKGIWFKDGMGSCKVAIKVIRANNNRENGQEILNKRLRKEILVWHALEHQHILPLLGLTYDFGRDKPMGMVCPWLDNGNLNGYLDRHAATLTLRDRFRILCDVATGLSYLHSLHVVHGDLTGSNILLDDEGKALLADFGLSNIIVEAYGPSYITSSIGGSVRWAAPEHFRISDGERVSTVTTHGDIYSYGSVVLQVLSGKLPYHHLAKDSEVLITLHRGAHPPRPQEIADEQWAMITRCWAEDPPTRPDIKYISERVQKHYLAQFASTDCEIVPRILDSAQTTHTENVVVLRSTQFLMLAFICVFIMGSFILYHTLMHWLHVYL